MKLLTTVFILALATLLVGCNNTVPRRDPSYAPARPVLPPPLPPGNGAIYNAGYETSWFEDLRARRVGDILTITLVESTAADKSAKTSVTKANSNSIANPT
ncbi:MAG: flagellar basal body L-ring protein FlgH, partial [Gammaproteobacteria bacterium]|nr:flagellar basal body L-ring protein FlgH [Gammaproteobacteria bacterium]